MPSMKQRTPKLCKRQPLSKKREYLRLDEVEAISGLSPWTWRRWAYSGKIASVKAGKRLLIPVSEFRRVMNEGYRPALETTTEQV